MDLQIRVRKQVLTCRQTAVANSVNFVKAHFEFDSEWEGTEKHVIFTNDTVQKELILDESLECIVPWEVLDNAGYLYISVVGKIEDQIRITVKRMDDPVTVYDSGDLGGVEPYPPTPDAWDSKADNIQVNEDGTLQLTAGGKPIGDAVKVSSEVPTNLTRSYETWYNIAELKDVKVSSPAPSSYKFSVFSFTHSSTSNSFTISIKITTQLKKDNTVLEILDGNTRDLSNQSGYSWSILASADGLTDSLSGLVTMLQGSLSGTVQLSTSTSLGNYNGWDHQGYSWVLSGTNLSPADLEIYREMETMLDMFTDIVIQSTDSTFLEQKGVLVYESIS